MGPEISKWLECYGVACLVLAFSAGIAALGFAKEESPLGAITAFALSAFWGTSGLLALTFNSRHVRANQRAHVVDQVLDYLLHEAKNPSGKPEKAEFIDRLHDLASKTIDASTPRNQ